MSLYVPEILQYTWENKPATAPLGKVICITDIGENGILCRGNGTKWVRMHAIRYYDLTAPVSLTGTTIETVLASFTLKGGLLGANGKLKIWPLASATSNANNKTMYFKMESVTFFSAAYTTPSASIQPVWLIRNNNSESSQISFSSGSQQGLGTGSIAATTASVDTSVDVTCTFSAKLTNESDTFTLHGFFVELI